VSEAYDVELTGAELEELESMVEVEIIQARRAIRRATPNSEFKQDVIRHERFLAVLRTKLHTVARGQAA